MKKFEELTEFDVYIPNNEVIGVINSKCDELGLERITRSCIDCIRKKYLELHAIIDPPTVLVVEGIPYVANFVIMGEVNGLGYITRNCHEELLKLYFHKNPKKFKRYEEN